ncbi:major facilitator superfamily domain-containing protein [Umbelopsis sp. PMI_123]|nr:major facilitator superfamily domain-containing protein [Umbelopsis sp. PMI_123]
MELPSVEQTLDTTVQSSRASASDPKQSTCSVKSADETTTLLRTIKNNAMAITGCFYVGILLGMTDGQFGVILPSIKDYYNISDSVVSVLFICQATGYFAAAFSNGWIVQKLKQVGALYLGGILILIAYVLLLIGLPFPAMCCFMPIMGIGFALLDSGVNVYPSTLPYTTTLLNLIHAFYGLGSLLGPLMASSLYANHMSWKVSYMILAGMTVVNLGLLFLAFHKARFEDANDSTVGTENRENTESEKHAQPQHSRFIQSIRLRITWVLAIFLLFYVGVEVTVGGWGYTFLTVARHGDAVEMGRIMSAYWAGLTIGRVALGHITTTFGEKRTILVYLIVTIGMIIMIWQTSTIASNSAGLVILGIFLGPMLPTAIAFPQQVIPKHLHATAVGFLVAFAQGGAALFPFISGVIIDKVGIFSIVPYVFGLAVIMFISWILVPTEEATFPWLRRMNVRRLKTKL